MDIEINTVQMANGTVVDLIELYKFIDELRRSHSLGNNENDSYIVEKFHFHLYDLVEVKKEYHLRYAKFDNCLNHFQWLDATEYKNFAMATKSQLYGFIAAACREKVKTGMGWNQAFIEIVFLLGNRWPRDSFLSVDASKGSYYFYTLNDSYAFKMMDCLAPTVMTVMSAP